MLEPCVFCNIASGKESAFVVFEGERTMAILDRFPIAPGHTLVITKKHYSDFLSLNDGDDLYELAKVSRLVGIAVKNGLRADGIRLFTNVGRAAAQAIFHVHIHVLPIWFNEPKFTWFRRRAELTKQQGEYLLSKIRPELEKLLAEEGLKRVA